MKTSPLFLLIFVPVICDAQLQVKGRVNIESGAALPYASVLLLNAPDSSLVRLLIDSLPVRSLSLPKGPDAPFGPEADLPGATRGFDRLASTGSATCKRSLSLSPGGP